MDELTLHFKGHVLGGSPNGQAEVRPALTGLTFIHTATQKDAKRLLTTDFNADPNVCPRQTESTDLFIASEAEECHICWRLSNCLVT